MKTAEIRGISPCALNYKKQDEYYTPPYAIEPMLDYIRPGSTVWCPFDTRHSHFAKCLRKHGCKVITSHLEEGKDFFTHEPNRPYDYVISNPPFSKKTEVIERLYQLDKPFAMLLNFAGLFESKRFHLLKNNDFELMLFNKRITFFTNYQMQIPERNPPFSTVYLTRNVLPERIVFREIEN